MYRKSRLDSFAITHIATLEFFACNYFLRIYRARHRPRKYNSPNMHSRYFVAAILFVLAGSINAVAAPAPDPPFLVSRVAEGVFVHFGVHELMTDENEGATANIGFIIGDDSVAVIDSGGSVREGSRFLASIRSLTSKPIRYVINTHAHPDHLFGNAAFKREGAVIVGHRNVPRALSMRGQSYLGAFRRSMPEVMSEVELIGPQQLIEKETRLDLGNRVLTLHAWPAAHSDTDLTILDESTNTLFAGDLVFLQHIPVVDGSLRGWLTTLKQLTLIPARIVVPGHGPVAKWPQAIDDEQRYLERLAQDCRALIASGASLAQAALTAGLTEKARWELFEAYNARNATAAFAELEWE